MTDRCRNGYSNCACETEGVSCRHAFDNCGCDDQIGTPPTDQAARAAYVARVLTEEQRRALPLWRLLAEGHVAGARCHDHDLCERTIDALDIIDTLITAGVEVEEKLNESSTALRENAPEWLHRLEAVAAGNVDQWDPKYGIGALCHILRSFHERDSSQKQTIRAAEARLTAVRELRDELRPFRKAFAGSTMSTAIVLCGAVDQLDRILGDAPTACICPKKCDCQDEARGLVSELCPEHNLYPRPDDDCPVHEWDSRVGMRVKTTGGDAPTEGKTDV